MAIEFDCPNCRTRIRTPEEAAGKKARCPNCEQISPVPYSSPLPSLNPFGDAGSSPPQADHSAPWLPPADAFAPETVRLRNGLNVNGTRKAGEYELTYQWRLS